MNEKENLLKMIDTILTASNLFKMKNHNYLSNKNKFNNKPKWNFKLSHTIY